MRMRMTTMGVWFLATCAVAQQDGGLARDAAATLFAQGPRFDEPAAGEVWAAHHTWKAGFTTAGVEFVPFLGGDVPSRSLRLALRAAQVGGVPLPLADATPQRAGQRVDYERGALREQYVLGAAGVEQQFAITELSTRGELVIEVGVQTALQHRTDGDQHVFSSPQGGVRFGSAVALDANGRRCAMATAWTGTALRLVVPAAFVAEATLPLLVDPLIGTEGSAPAVAQAIGDCDIAYDYSLGQFYVCFERAYSATDHDVYVAVFDAQMNWQSTQTIDFTTAYWTRPRIATLEQQNLACVVAQSSAANASPFVVRYRLFTGGPTPTLQPAVQVPAGIGSDYLDPDVGGDSAPGVPGRFLIACSRQDSVNDSSVIYWTLDGGGLSAGHVVTTGVGLERRIAVSKTCGTLGGSSNVWALVWRHEVYQATTGELHATFVDRTGVFHDPVGPNAYFVLTPTTTNSGSEWDVSSPTDDGLGRRFACAETRVQGSGTGVIVGHVFDWNGSIAVGDAVLLNSVFDRRHPRIDSDGCRFVLAAENDYATSSEARITMFEQVGAAMNQCDVAFSTPDSGADVVPAIAAMPGAAGNAYGVAWIHADAATWQVQGQRYHGVAAGGFSQRTTGCGGLGIFAFGTAAIGESFGVALTGVVGLTGFLAGTIAGNQLPGCGSCVQGADGQILLGTQLNVDVPRQPALVGVQLSLQGLQLLPGPGPCLGQFELSDTIDLIVQ